MKPGSSKSVRISGEPLINALVVAAKRDHRTLANFVLRLIEKAQPFWEKDDWDKNYFGSDSYISSSSGVHLLLPVSPRWSKLN